MGTITQKLQSKLSGTEEVNINDVLSILYNKIHHKEARGPHSHLHDILTRVAQLRAQQSLQEDKVNRILESRRQLSQVQEELKNIDLIYHPGET